MRLKNIRAERPLNSNPFTDCKYLYLYINEREMKNSANLLNKLSKFELCPSTTKSNELTQLTPRNHSKKLVNNFLVQKGNLK